MFKNKLENSIKELINEIKKTKAPVYVFGNSRASWYCIKVLEYFEIEIKGIIKSEFEDGDTFLNFKLFSKEEVFIENPESIIILGVFNPNTTNQIVKILQSVGLRIFYTDITAILYTFLREVVKRECDGEILAKSIHILVETYKTGISNFGINSQGEFVSPQVTSYITQKCTLQCIGCGALIPKYKSPKNFDVKSVVDDIRVFSAAFDVVPEISFSGGEPFLNPDFDEICYEVSKIPNIVFINFTTNGTLLPDENKIKVLASCGADLHQSDYGDISKHQKEIFNLCEKHSLYCDINFVNENHLWTEPPKFEKMNRSDELNNKLYIECIESGRYCLQLMAGELHRCAASVNGTHQGLIPEYSEDIVKLHDPKKTDSTKIKEIRHLVTRRTALNNCDECNLPYAKFITPAVQESKKFNK